MPIDVDLAELERRLGGPPPTGYVRWLEATGPEVAVRRSLDPKTICIFNLMLRMTRPSGHTRGRFFFGGDGCGNYYFVADGSRHEEVELLARDPPGIETTGRRLRHFLATYEQDSPIQLAPGDGQLCITRADVIGESPLVPISLDEWERAAPGVAGIRYVGARITKHPFTGAELRIPAPGLSFFQADGREHKVAWWAGALTIDRASLAARPVADAIAAALGARVIAGWESSAGLLH